MKNCKDTRPRVSLRVESEHDRRVERLQEGRRSVAVLREEVRSVSERSWAPSDHLFFWHGPCTSVGLSCSFLVSLGEYDGVGLPVQLVLLQRFLFVSFLV